jgi:hypothetical protein
MKRKGKCELGGKCFRESAHEGHAMNILAWIVVGLLPSQLARRIVPGPEGGGLVATLLLGILGAILGGWIASA